MELGIPSWHRVGPRAGSSHKRCVLLSGCFIHSVDDKNRISLPARLRNELPGGFVLTKGADGCLWALPQDKWSLVLQKGVASTAVQRFLVASACHCAPGAKGRFLLPDSLRKHAEIRPGEEVAIIGLGSRIEIWSLRRWEAISSQITRERLEQDLPELFSDTQSTVSRDHSTSAE